MTHKPRKRKAEFSVATTYLLLVSRLILFLVFQALIALLVNSWEISKKYWLLTATLTNIVSILLLVLLFKRDGGNFFKIFSVNRRTLKKDIPIFLGLTVLSVPIVFLPPYFLGSMLWDNPDIPTEMMFRPIQKELVYVLMLAFPVSIAMAEIATYFVFIMPKLLDQLKVKWLAVLLPVVFLSIQHITLPFIPDINFIVYRSVVYLPFATLIGISIYHRPSLFIYFAVLHGTLDFGTVIMYL